MIGLSLVGSSHRNAPQTSIGRWILAQNFYKLKDTVAAAALVARLLGTGIMLRARVYRCKPKLIITPCHDKLIQGETSHGHQPEGKIA